MLACPLNLLVLLIIILKAIFRRFYITSLYKPLHAWTK